MLEQGEKLMEVQLLEEYSSNFFINPDKEIYPSPITQIYIDKKPVWVKRDDKLDLECSKQRSLIYMIMKYLEMGKHKFVVSSSGNAALVSAFLALFCNTSPNNIEELKILLSNQISDVKLEKFIRLLEIDISIDEFRKGFKENNVSYEFCDNPKQRAFQLGKEEYINLRGSTDDLALKGFKTIAFELSQQVENTDAVFVPASSGSTALGIYEGFQDSTLNPQIHVVQTTKCRALLKNIVQNTLAEEEHPAESIVDMIGHRRLQVEEMITETNGKGWIISAKETIEAYEELLNTHDIKTSYDSALSYAAYKKAAKEQIFNNPVLIFTGS